MLRTGQALDRARAAIDGALLLATGQDLPALHLVYGLTPLAVSFLAEQLRLPPPTPCCRQRDLEDAQAMRGSPRPSSTRSCTRSSGARRA